MSSRTPSLASAPSRRRRADTVSSLASGQRGNGPHTPASATPVVSTPARVGDSRSLSVWVHDPSEYSGIIVNRAVWNAGGGSVIRAVVADGDVVSESQDEYYFLFIMPEDTEETQMKYGLQISIPQSLADTFGIKNRDIVQLTKVERKRFVAEYLELTFQDQYLGRNDMWRLVEQLENKGKGTCIHVGEEVLFLGFVAARVTGIHVNGNMVSSGVFGATTKVTYRSLSAKTTIFIQVCREIWDFAGDGERYNEKVVHSFLPALIKKWRDAGARHTVTLVLISRVFYDNTERSYAAGPLRPAPDGGYYKDFFKVIADAEIIHDWKPTLVRLKQAFTTFQRDILLTHHYHRGEPDGEAPAARLVGRLSYAHDGPILEAINLVLGSSERHFIDRALSLTGASTIIITPSTGVYYVDKHLLRLTTNRVLDHGFGVDLVCLAPRPLHQAPIFSFQGLPPVQRSNDPRACDPLWGGDHRAEDVGERMQYWWEPFWMSTSFWDRQMDLPFRQDRFVARARMHKIQMLGLLAHDVLSSIEIPFMKEPDTFASESSSSSAITLPPTMEEADQFDQDIFDLPKPARPPALSRNSYSSSSSTIIASSFGDRRNAQRASVISTSSLRTIGPIEESPRRDIIELPAEIVPSRRPNLLHVDSQTTVKLSTSPSQMSIHSVASARTTSSTSTTHEGSKKASSGLLKPLWFLNPFKPAPAKVDTATITAHASSSSDRSSAPSAALPIPRTSQDTVTPRGSPSMRSSQPVGIRRVRSRGSVTDQWNDDNASVTTQKNRTSPNTASPRESTSFGRRRSLLSGSGILTPVNTTQAPSPTNPLRAQGDLPPAQRALARRWQHFGPAPWFKHEMKWKSLVMPGCLPLSMESLPSTQELEKAYGVFSYESFVDPSEVTSFLVRPPRVVGGGTEDARRAFAHAVMHGMAAVRLAQGFQFVLRGEAKQGGKFSQNAISRTESFSTVTGEEEAAPLPRGVASVKGRDIIYLSTSNEIHRISYNGDSIQVRRYVRNMTSLTKFKYECLIWPRLGVGYTEMRTQFDSLALGEYGWNRLDMLVAGYEQHWQFSESLRYWRTRFIVIPSDVPSATMVMPQNERLDDEEIRLTGMDKLAEMFTNARWRTGHGLPEQPPVRFLPTDLDPTACVLDDDLAAQLDQLHAAGPLQRRIQERYISDLSLPAIAKAMREEGGVQVKDYRWHGRKYTAAFVGSEFVSWLCREFHDVPTREEGVKWGNKLQAMGLYDHGRGRHGFLDGYYYYQLKGEYATVPSTPRTSWFRPAPRQLSDDSNIGFRSPRQTRKQLILSQSMVVDVDKTRRSDQAETAILHHDIIHNPGTAFHFELHWIGTTARCIQELIHRQWGWNIEKYGLKLVEAYVGQIADIQQGGANPFQSCYPIRLAAPPPSTAELPYRLADGATQRRHPFECAILKRFDFILDIEAGTFYPPEVDVYYSYRASTFTYSQYVHRSGVAFVQLIGGSDGFLFLTNRLMQHGRLGPGGGRKHELDPFDAAEDLRVELDNFCSDRERLEELYAEELRNLHTQVPLSRRASEEPPDLSI